MKTRQGGAAFDPDTIGILKQVLDETWATLRPDQQATMSRTELAAGILAVAATGERDPIRLRTGALLRRPLTSDAA